MKYRGPEKILNGRDIDFPHVNKVYNNLVVNLTDRDFVFEQYIAKKDGMTTFTCVFQEPLSETDLRYLSEAINEENVEGVTITVNVDEGTLTVYPSEH